LTYRDRAVAQNTAGADSQPVWKLKDDSSRMEWYLYVACAAIAAQLLFLYNAVRNYRYALAKYRRRPRPGYRPRAAVVVPCKGLDARFHANIESFLDLDGDNYDLIFVVQEESDPAYRELREIVSQSRQRSRARDIRILVAGLSDACSQKIHNLLYAFHHLPEETEVLAFADSDICVRRDWLRHLTWPLRRAKCGVATGYRWFVPTRNNLATLGLSSINAAVAQLLGNNRFNHAWGGSMAVRTADFRRLGLPEIWKHTLSDDLSLSVAVKKAGMIVTFVPGCLAASYESTTWSGLYEFCRRQFLITRVYAPMTWWLGLVSSLGSAVGFWGTAAMAGYAWAIGADHRLLYTAVPVLFFVGQLIRAILRQAMIARLLREHAPSVKAAMIADALGFGFWSVLQLIFITASAFGRTIRWRGIRYRLVSPARTEVLAD
jgi:cellulose synthase/poly-beta-1,6-N-acetylglucosamine synthase-like glycosyltransferase